MALEDKLKRVSEAADALTRERTKGKDDPQQEEAYEIVKQIQLEILHIPLVSSICHGFIPGSFIKYYETHPGGFTEKQLRYIYGVNKKIQAFRRANQDYEKAGHKKELLELMEDVVQASTPTDASERASLGQFKVRISNLSGGNWVNRTPFYTIAYLVKVFQPDNSEELLERNQRLRTEFETMHNKYRAASTQTK